MPERHIYGCRRRRATKKIVEAPSRTSLPQWILDLEVDDLDDLSMPKGYKARSRNWPAGTLGQDLFAYRLIGNNGFFLDIGCGNPIAKGGSA